MKTKDTTDRTQRLARRNSLIRMIFHELIIQEKYSYGASYIFLGRFFGLNDRQIRKILLQKDEVALSADDLSKFSVILQRFSEEKRIRDY